MRLYFVRHGESEANLLHVFSNRGLIHGLTDKGRQQARALAQHMEGIAVAKLFSSPLLRAVQTAEILGCGLGVPYETTDALREFDCGILEGKSDASSHDLFHEVVDAWLQQREWARRLEGGESFLDIKARFVPFIEQLVAGHGHLPDNLVLVGHGATYRCMLPLLLDDVDFEFAVAHPLSNTGYVIAEEGEEGLVCVEWRESIS
jgi:broad specificity phosphatase PhoE